MRSRTIDRRAPRGQSAPLTTTGTSPEHSESAAISSASTRNSGCSIAAAQVPQEPSIWDSLPVFKNRVFPVQINLSRAPVAIVEAHQICRPKRTLLTSVRSDGVWNLCVPLDTHLHTCGQCSPLIPRFGALNDRFPRQDQYAAGSRLGQAGRRAVHGGRCWSAVECRLVGQPVVDSQWLRVECVLPVVDVDLDVGVAGGRVGSREIRRYRVPVGNAGVGASRLADVAG